MPKQVPVKLFARRLFEYHRNPLAPCPLCGGVEFWIDRKTGAAVCYNSACGWSRGLDKTSPATEPVLMMCAN